MKALCLRLDRFVQGNKDALALVRVPTESHAIHRQREQLVTVRKVLEAQGAVNGQSRDRTGATMVEAAGVCRTESAAMDQTVVRQQPAHRAAEIWSPRRPFPGGFVSTMP